MKKNKVTSIENNQAKFGKDLNFAATEAYNLLKTNLTFSLEKKENGLVIGITSSEPQEGKTYTSINLAYSLAVDGSKVLLIDGDMRKPTVTSKLEIVQEKGLSNILAGDTEDCVLKNVLTDNLDIITSGVIPPNPSQLIRSNKMKELLDKCRNEYDYILLDLPPVNAVSDSIGVSTYTDGIILVCKHGYTRRKEFLESVRQLKFVKANIIGSVYNGYQNGGSYYRKGNKYYKHSTDYYQKETK